MTGIQINNGILFTDMIEYNPAVPFPIEKVFESMNAGLTKVAYNGSPTSTRGIIPVKSNKGVVFMSLPLRMVDGKIINQL